LIIASPTQPVQVFPILSTPNINIIHRLIVIITVNVVIIIIGTFTFTFTIATRRLRHRQQILELNRFPALL